MPQEIRLWRIGNEDRLSPVAQTALNLEARLQKWLARDISILGAERLVIGREVETAFGCFIDLLCIDREGDLVIVELKRDKTSREVIAQALDYASWVSDLSSEEISDIASKHLGSGRSLEEAFREHFKKELPNTLNEGHRMLIVASKIDPSSERIMKYLSSSYGVNINAVTFHYFKTNESEEFLGRVFLLDPSEVEYQTRTKGGSKRRPNLTYEELDQQAKDNGVSTFYQRLKEGLEKHLRPYTTGSSIGFGGDIDKGRKSIFSLLPGKSNQSEGLAYEIYWDRFKNRFNLSDEAAALELLPHVRERWGAGNSDFSGFRGYFANESEVDRFLQLLGGHGVATVCPEGPRA
jgi:hypothetical protein